MEKKQDKKGNKKNKNKNNPNPNVLIKKEIHNLTKLINRSQKTTESFRKVDDFLKNIKSKKEQKEIQKEKEINKDLIKLTFINNYKYLFSLDPAGRLRLRENNIELSTISTDIISYMFSTFKTYQISTLEKDQIKDICILIDSFAEILIIKTDASIINEFISQTIIFINYLLANLQSNYNENNYTIIFNAIYTLLKIQNEVENISINDNTIIAMCNEMLQNEILSYNNNEENKSNKIFDIKTNVKLTSSLFLCLLVSILYTNANNNNDNINNVKELLDKLISFLNSNYSSISNKEHLPKNTKHNTRIDNNINSMLIQYSNLKIIMKLYSLFDIKKDLFYSLNIKTTKYIEKSFSSYQNIFTSFHSEMYLDFILNLIQLYFTEFILNYEHNNKFYEDIFSLLQLIIEKEHFNESKHINKKSSFINNISFQNPSSIQNDDSLNKYIMFIMKCFKLINTETPGTYEQIYITFFLKVFTFISEIKQSYIKDKNLVLLYREIEPKLTNDVIVDMVHQEIIKKISTYTNNDNNSNNNINIVKGIKDLKSFISFFEKNNNIKQKVINNIKTVNDNMPLLTLVFLLNFVNIDKDVEDIKTFPYKQIIFIDIDVYDYIFNYYISKELLKLQSIQKMLFELNKTEIQNDIFTRLIKAISIDMEMNEVLFCIKLISKYNIQTFPIKDIIDTRNDKNYAYVDSVVLYYMVNYDMNESKNEFKLINERYKNEIDFVDEIEKVNKNNKTYFYKDKYINDKTQIINCLLQIRKVDLVLKDNKDYFKVETDDIIVESEPVNIETSIEGVVKEELFKDEMNDNSNTNTNTEQINEHNEKTKDKNVAKPEPPKANIGIIINVFTDIISNAKYILLQDNITTSEHINEYFYFNQIQHFINNTLSNDNIFTLLTPSPETLSKFIKKYISFKNIIALSKQTAENTLTSIKETNPYLSSNTESLCNQIQSLLLHISLLSSSEHFISNLITSKCSKQLPHLLPESEIFKLLQTKNLPFLQSVSNSLEAIYKKQILEEHKINSLLTRIQNEDEDNLEEVIYEIFSKETITYLSNPKEIISFLTSINEGMKYDILPSQAPFYESIFPYFYTWKCLILKIVNGFQLYTSNKQYEDIIKQYKTLLRFIIYYLEKNSLLYEMFLLIVVSLLHLINNDDISETSNLNFDNFDEKLLTDHLDTNTYQFLLNMLFKFVKIFPSLVKEYYNSKTNKLKNNFKNLICTYILPKLLVEFKEKVKSSESVLNKNGIYLAETMSSNYIELRVTSIEEIKIVLCINIPPIFPLKKIKVDIKCNASLDEKKMLNMKMNLTSTINNSVDNLSDNLIIWKDDVKSVIIGGNEPCPICFFYLHTTDKSLPSLHCKTCKKKFHGLCIKEWFKNLRQQMQDTTCPMCRSQWKLK